MDAQKEQTGDAFLRQGAEQRQSALYGICLKDKIFIYGGLKLQVQLSKQMLEELIPGPVTREQFTDIFDHFRKAFIKRVMQAEMSHHLGCGVGEAEPERGHQPAQRQQFQDHNF